MLVRARVLNIGVASVLLVGVVAMSPQVGVAAASCSPMTTRVTELVKPSTAASHVTTSVAVANRLKLRQGYEDDLGMPFAVAPTNTTGDFVPVKRLHNPSTGDTAWLRRGAEADRLRAGGYVDQGAPFYASPNSASGCVPVFSFVRGGMHRLAGTPAYRAQLTAEGWRRDRVAFYAAPVAVDPTFSFAMMPDTQKEVVSSTDRRFGNRTQWLVANRSALDLRWVGHSGDVVNWGWLEQSQFDVAVRGTARLEAAGIPYAYSLGSHDTRVVGRGGSAYVSAPECLERFGSQCSGPLLLRRTEEFNQNFQEYRYGGLAGAFETGKLDNVYSTFNAGGKKWMLLTLELWPRYEAISWARSVVAAHRDYNVIVQTHSYLNSDGSIQQGNGGYGTSTAQYLFDNLVKRYANIRLVFSGHVGTVAMRTDRGTQGNTVHSFLQTLHAPDNPVRVVSVNAATGTLRTWIYSPDLNRTDRVTTLTGIDWVDPGTT